MLDENKFEALEIEDDELDEITGGVMRQSTYEKAIRIIDRSGAPQAKKNINKKELEKWYKDNKRHTTEEVKATLKSWGYQEKMS